MVVYIEDVLVENFLIDLSLLYTAQKLTRCKIGKVRLVLASVFGAALAVGLPLLNLSGFASLSAKICSGVLLCILSLKKPSNRRLLAVTAVFFALTFGYAGVLFALYNRWDVATEHSNGYWVESAPVALVLSAVLFFSLVLSSASVGFFKKKIRAQYIFPCTLLLNGASFECSGYLDSGNLVFDGVEPVAIVSSRVMKSLVDVKRVAFRKIPVSTVNGNSFLSAFRIDALMIYSDGKPNIIKNVTVGISDRLKFDCDIILHPAFWEDSYESTV